MISSKDILKKIKDTKKKIIDNDPNLAIMSDIRYDRHNCKTELFLKQLHALQWKYLITKINETHDKSLEKLKDNLSIMKKGYIGLIHIYIKSGGTDDNIHLHACTKEVNMIYDIHPSGRIDYLFGESDISEMFCLPKNTILYNNVLVGKGSIEYCEIMGTKGFCVNSYFNGDRESIFRIMCTIIENLDILIEKLPKNEFLKNKKFVFLDYDLKPITIDWYKKKWENV